jgi:hypothetical protein
MTRSRFLAVLLSAGSLLFTADAALGRRGEGKAASPTPATIELARSIDLPELGFRLRYPDGWSVPPRRFTNMYEIVNVPFDKQTSVRPTAKVKITTEEGRDHAEALLRVRQIAFAVGAPPSAFVEIGGWPAFQWGHIEDVPQRGRDRQRNPGEKRLAITTAIASGSRLVRLEAILPLAADFLLIEKTKAVGRSIVFREPGDPMRVQEELDHARENPIQAPTRPPVARPDETSSGPGLFSSETVASPASQRIITDNDGELEVAVSPNGRNIVVGNQSLWAASNDGGSTWPVGLSGGINFSGGDPSLAWGQGGRFYYAGIRGGCQAADAAGPYGYTCTGIARSDDNGATFPIVGNASVCPNGDPDPVNPPNGEPAGDCFPDQEHIAADRVNAGPGGADQVYNTWRNFVTNPNDQDPALTCSQDSGVTWTAPVTVGNGAFPRIAAGPNGIVYVVYEDGASWMLRRYSSCATGLVPQGVAIPITARTPIVCPFVGHDRCDQNPSSQTIAVDDTNPNHVYFAYAEDAGGGSDTIFVQDSIDGGATWPAARTVQVNSAVPGKRIMPWVCTTGGTAFVTWYDRRAATPCPAPPCAAPNDVTDYYAGSASLDFGGNLVVGTEFKISDVSDNWCDTGWRCGTREVASAEQCSTQPQLAGFCRDSCANPSPPPGGTDTQQPCDFSDGCSGAAAGETCCTDNGCPKYGDYNGNACAAGRLFGAWPSRLAPATISPDLDNRPDIFFAGVIVGDVPVITVPGNVSFKDTCVGATSTATLNVCNTGTANLEVTSIADNSTQFAVTAPSSGYPVVISPDFCFPFQVTFTPTSAGLKTATITINSNDPSNPSIQVQASGTGTVPDVRVSGSTAFGDVCAGSTAEKVVNVCNVGGCNLNVVSAVFDPPCADFTLINNPFPAPVSPDFCAPLTVRFTPTSAGPKSCTLKITTDDPDTPMITLTVTGNTPSASIDVPPDMSFPAEVVQSVGACTTAQPFPISNTGRCPLTITSVAIAGPNPDLGDYSMSGLPSFPIILEPGHIVGEGDFDVVFGPTVVDRDRLGNIRVTYVSDAVTGATTMVTRELCGEGVRTGARVLVTAGGVPLAMVDSIHLQRLTANRNKKLLDSVDNARDLPLTTVDPDGVCPSFQYHREYGTVSNPIQLAPGSYSVTVSARVDGRIRKKTVGFDVQTCDFNPTVVVDLP